MQPGAVLRSVLLAVLLAGPRGARSRLLSGECALWVGGWCRVGWADAPSARQPFGVLGFQGTIARVWDSRDRCFLSILERSKSVSARYRGGSEDAGWVEQWADLLLWVLLQAVPLSAVR
jgi:hypothetical protein